MTKPPHRTGLSLNQKLTLFVGIATVVVGVGSLWVANETYQVAADTNELSNAVNDLANIAGSSRDQVDRLQLQVNAAEKQINVEQAVANSAQASANSANDQAHTLSRQAAISEQANALAHHPKLGLADMAATSIIESSPTRLTLHVSIKLSNSGEIDAEAVTANSIFAENDARAWRACRSQAPVPPTLQQAGDPQDPHHGELAAGQKTGLLLPLSASRTTENDYRVYGYVCLSYVNPVDDGIHHVLYDVDASASTDRTIVPRFVDTFFDVAADR